MLVIAIPGITKYITTSRNKTYLRTLDSYADGLSKMIANNELPGMYEEDTTYYIPFNCIPIEKGGKSPNGDWEFAYVLTTNQNNQIKKLIVKADIVTSHVGTFGYNAIETAIYKGNVKTIGGLFDARALTNLTISEGVTTIKAHAFYGNTLSNIRLPKSVATIEVVAFGVENKNLTLVGRSDTSDMNLQSGWNGTATVVFEP